MRNRRFESSFLNFASSLKIAGVLLLILAVCIVVATFSQSYYDSSQAWVNETFYHTWWFLGLQAMLLICMWLATVRIFQKTWRQLGVIVIHVGVTFLIVGSALTHGWGIVGARVDLWEGESTSVATETENFVAEVKWRTPDGKEVINSFDSPFFARASQKNWDIKIGPWTLRASPYYPDGEIEYLVDKEGGAQDPPGIRLKLRLPGMPFEPEKVLRAQAPGDLWSKGVFAVSYRDLDPQDFVKVQKETLFPGLQIRLKERNETLAVVLDPNEEPQEFVLGDHTLKFEKFVSSFLIDAQGKPIKDDGAWRNPTFIWKWWPNDNPSDAHLEYYFANHSQFHSRSPLFEVGFVDLSPLSNQALPDLVVLTWGGENPELWQRLFEGCWQRSVFSDENKASFSVGDTAASFEIIETYPHTTIQTLPRPLTQELRVPLLGWHLYKDSEPVGSQQWALIEDELIFEPPDGSQISLTYLARAVPMGFRVKLNDVIQINDPGIAEAATWSSLIEIEDPELPAPREFRVDMNDPIDYKGFRFFQANYQERQGAEQTGLMVAKDPGFMIYYIGIVVTVLGMILNFYCKDWLGQFDRKAV